MQACWVAEASLKDKTAIIGYTGGGGHGRAEVREAPGLGQELGGSGGLKELGDSGGLTELGDSGGLRS